MADHIWEDVLEPGFAASYYVLDSFMRRIESIKDKVHPDFEPDTHKSLSVAHCKIEKIRQELADAMKELYKERSQ